MGCSVNDVMARRFRAQLLSGPSAGAAVDVVRRLLAVQGQDPRGARLAIRARSTGLTAADVDHALTVDRSLLISWLNRGTLHMVTTEDYWWLHALTTPPMLAGNARRLAQEGVPAGDAEAALGVIAAALGEHGPLTRGQLAERISAAGIRTQGQALVHLLAKATIAGMIVRGPMIAGEHAFVLVSDWLGGTPGRYRPGRLDRGSALAELARRYLAGHGPASDRDLAKWAGLPLGDARRGLAAIGAELTQRDDDLVELAAGAACAGADLPPPRLLGSYDPLLHGYVEREPVLGPHREVITVNGLFRPFALVDGRAAGLWRLAGGQVDLEPFAPLAGHVTAALRADGEDVTRFLGTSPARPARSGQPEAEPAAGLA
jgi:hypothetical protein